MESQAEEAASDGSVTCPSCGHSNPAGLTRCERCTGPLTGPTTYHYESRFQRPERPAVVMGFVGLLLIVATFCVFAVVRGSWQWPIPVLAAVVCVVLAQGVWRLREWARLVTIFLLGLSMVGVICGVPGYWWQQKILPIAGVLAIICIFPPLVPLGLLLYWFLSNEEHFQ